MNLIERVKNILISPKTEWEVINNETATTGSLFMGYVLPLSVVAAIGTLLKYLLFTSGYAAGWGIKYGIIYAVIGFIASVAAFYLTTMIVDAMAPSFNSEKNMGKSAQLVAYSGTPSYIASFLAFIPVISLLIAIAGWVYGIYIMYLGIGPIKKTPEDKKVVYMLVVYVIMIAIYLILAAILGAIILAAVGTSVVTTVY